MDHFALLEILAIGFSLALVLGYVTHRLRLSPIVGYLMAGYLVGPNSPGYVADAAIAAQLAEVGVILLMFGVGLHFNLKDLLSVRGIAVPGAIGQSLVATALGVMVAGAFGHTVVAGLILGLGLAVASTVVLMRVLVENDMLDTPHGHAAVGWLIVEDIFTVLVLVLLPALAVIAGGSGRGGSGTLSSFGLALAKLAALWILILPVGGRVIPWLMGRIARSRSRELFTLTVLVLAFVIATGSARMFGASVALGAFLAGMVVGKSTVSHQAAADVLPMRDAFAVLFFQSVGMLFDPAFIMLKPRLVLACLAVILFAKPLAACLIVIVLGYSVRTALTVALGLAQIGEFSFILAQQAQALELFPPQGYSILVACALISISINPILFRLVIPLERWLRGRAWLWHLLNYRVERRGREANRLTQKQLEHGEQPLAIVVGYGPVGQEVAKLLKSFNWSAVIIDLNVDTVNTLVGEGQPAIYGDAGRREILEAAGIAHARHLLVTLPDLSNSISVISTARNLNPGLKILVRARYLGARDILEGLGPTAVAFEEEEVAKALTEKLLDEVKTEAGT